MSAAIRLDFLSFRSLQADIEPQLSLSSLIITTQRESSYIDNIYSIRSEDCSAFIKFYPSVDLFSSRRILCANPNSIFFLGVDFTTGHQQSQFSRLHLRLPTTRSLLKNLQARRYVGRATLQNPGPRPTPRHWHHHFRTCSRRGNRLAICPCGKTEVGLPCRYRYVNTPPTGTRAAQ